MPRYIRAYVPGGTYFFTVVLHDRRRPLLTERVDALREAFRKVRKKRPFRMEAVVVLPDHLHCIWTMPASDADFSTRWRLIKSSFARDIPESGSANARGRRKGERAVWQRRFWEHLIRNEEDLARHIDYIHFNPVKHGYVGQASEWPWSSFHRYVQRGIYAVDWAAPEAVTSLELE